MALTVDEVNHIADLARLKLSDEEKESYREQLSEILDFASLLQNLDTSEIPPTARVIQPPGTLRPDVPRPGLELEDLLLNAPDTEDGQFRVPPVLD
jgi:aspartyl-tRNA(Asn)/glutamyl-tRNA(Gln) amidotransferase subunit C